MVVDLRFSFKSDKGIIRDTNEDFVNVLLDSSGLPVAFIIADGMGGHNSGEIASKMAVDCISEVILEKNSKDITVENAELILREAMKKANTEVYNISKVEGPNSGMGTTLIAAMVIGDMLVIGHVGDSRVYRLRSHTIERITVDHSFVEELVRNGSLSREEAHNHPGKNLITRALGVAEEMEIDIYDCELGTGDSILMCTDGLTNMLDENEILELFTVAGEPNKACDLLIEKANDNGGEDNISVIVIMS
jgi:protein phosphatase